ncbi:MAG: GNAT family N-acetyltransferase [Candidatus Methanofastidiosum sp.]|nr:GNAT family N-acetyltransferase [Methanofastidiosum sp.]
MDQIEILPAKYEDHDEIHGLLIQLWPDKIVDKENIRDIFQKGLENKSNKYLIARNKNVIVGFISLSTKNSMWQEGNIGHIDELIVDKNFRKMGVGLLLLDAITKIARENGCKRLELDSAFHRKEAHIFYEKNGFENRAFIFSKSLSK